MAPKQSKLSDLDPSIEKKDMNSQACEPCLGKCLNQFFFEIKQIKIINSC